LVSLVARCAPGRKKECILKTLKTVVLSASLLVCVTAAFAASKVTTGVGHMCCGKCKAAATQGLAKVADDITIDGDNITLTPKGDDLLPALEALRKSGFPAKTLVVNGPVTLGVAHLCCGTCRAGLSKALTSAKLETLDTDSIKIGEDSVTLNAKAGMKLDLIPLIAGMEKGGFYPSKITVGSASASKSGSAAKRYARR
jgi:hypothetical protein